MGKLSASRHHSTGTVAPAAPSLGSNPTITASSVTLTIVPAALPTGAAAVSAFYVYQNGVKVKTLGPTELTPTITGLTGATLYRFSVSAYNGQESARSADLAVSTLSASAPSAPGTLLITSKPSTSSAVLAWSAATAPDTDPVQGYRVRKVGSTTVLLDTASLTGTVTGLVDGDQLFVKAYNGAGQGPSSNLVTFTVDTGMTALPAGRVGATYSIAQPKVTGTYSNRATTKAAIADLGIKQMRARFTPASTEYVARAKEFADDLGVRWIARFGAFEEADTAQDTPEQLVTKLIANFGTNAGNPSRLLTNYVFLIEGWNEPNNNGIPWIDRTVAYTKATSDACKAEPQINGVIPVGGPSLARISGTGAEGPSLQDQANNFAAAAQAVHGQSGQGLKPWVDRGITHIYPQGKTPSTDYDYFTPIARAIYPAPMQIATTEGGYSTDMLNTTKGNPTPEAVAGIYADRHICEHILRGSMVFNQHELWDDALPASPTDVQRRESSFGLLRADGTHKPAYETIKNFLALFKDEDTSLRPKSTRATTALAVTVSPTPGAASSTTNTLRSLLFQHSDGTYRLVLWRDISVKFSSTSPYTITPLTALTVTVTLPAVMGVTQYQPSVQAGPTVNLTSASSATVSLKDNLTVLKLAP